MKFFQDPYNWCKNLVTPAWLKRILGVVRIVAKEVFNVLKEDATNYLKEEVFKQMSLDISGKDKMQNVIKGFKERFINIQITDQMLNLAIELILAEVKKQ